MKTEQGWIEKAHEHDMVTKKQFSGKAGWDQCFILLLLIVLLVYVGILLFEIKLMLTNLFPNIATYVNKLDIDTNINANKPFIPKCQSIT